MTLTAIEAIFEGRPGFASKSLPDAMQPPIRCRSIDAKYREAPEQALHQLIDPADSAGGGTLRSGRSCQARRPGTAWINRRSPLCGWWHGLCRQIGA